MERIEKLKEFLAATPNDPFLQHALALEYVKLGKSDDARNLFEQILTSRPDYVGSYYHLAKLLEQKGEPQLAAQWYKKGIDAADLARDNHAKNELRAALDELEE